MGYLFEISSIFESSIKSTRFESLLTQNTNDFGDIQILNINNFQGIAQFRCSCEFDCSAPVLLRVIIELENNNIISLYNYYQPPSILPPQGGECTTFYETIQEEQQQQQQQQQQEQQEIVSGLSMMLVRCGGWEFFDGGMGVVGERIYYENGGNQYPRLQTVFGAVQFTLPCGENKIFSEIVGIGEQGVSYTTITTTTTNVASWREDDEDTFDEIEKRMSNSPNRFLGEGFLYSTLRTMQLPCFDDDSFIPLNEDEILDEILARDPPTNIQDVLEESPILSLVTNGDKSDLIFERFEDYLNIALVNNDTETTVEVSENVVQGVSDLITNTDNSEIIDNGYNILGDVETTLACGTVCGEDGVVVENDFVTVGAQYSTLEQLASQPIFLGDTGASFSLPGDLSDLEEIFGRGACVYTGSNFVASPDGNAIPTASFTFYSINCTSGEREEILITIDDEFLIYLPIPEGVQEEEKEECEGEEKEEEEEYQCVSGETLGDVSDLFGCEVVEIQENQIVCGCTHLTAFSALFLPAENGECGGGWKWGTLQTVAACLIAGVTLTLIIYLSINHRKYKHHQQTIRNRMRIRKSLVIKQASAEQEDLKQKRERDKMEREKRKERKGTYESIKRSRTWNRFT